MKKHLACKRALEATVIGGILILLPETGAADIISVNSPTATVVPGQSGFLTFILENTSAANAYSSGTGFSWSCSGNNGSCVSYVNTPMLPAGPYPSNADYDWVVPFTAGSAIGSAMTTIKVTGCFSYTLPASCAEEVILTGDINIRPAIPEPSTWAMELIGLTGLCFASYRRSRTSSVLA